ncbi:MAG: EAL domain-containing protein [Ferrovum sp.]|nr:EAL domain-containing protein [Ferrovum sp.]
MEEARDRYIDLYDFAPIGYLTLDHEGKIEEINLTGAKLLGVERAKLIKRRFDLFIASRDRENWHRHFISVLLSDDIHTIEVKVERSNGSLIHSRLECLHLERTGMESRIRIALTDITENVLAYEALQESESLLRGSHTIAGLGSYVLNLRTGLWKSSAMLDHLLGIDGTYDRTIAGWEVLIYPDDRKMMQDYFSNDVWGLGRPLDQEFRIIRQNDGAERWLHGHGKIEFDVHNAPVKLLGTIRDITDQKSADQQVRIAATAFESQEGMVITDAEGIILRVNQAYTLITGYPSEDLVGKSSWMLQSGRQDENFYKQIWKTVSLNGFWAGEVWNKRKNGDTYPGHLTITAVKSDMGKTTHYVGTLTDITLSKKASDEIKHLAYYDLLTHLANRRLLQDRLKQALVSSGRSSKQGALLFLDLDDFKTLNDTLGHDTGDMLLEQVARRIESCVREGDTVSRFGGDEFVVMLENLSEDTFDAALQTETIANKIMSALNQSYDLAGHDCRSTASIGAILFKNQDHSYEELLKRADIAMYQAKNTGRNRLCFFDQSMQDSVNARAALEIDLFKALELEQLQLYFQIQVDRAYLPTGAEALIRWIHPQRGLIYPAQFILLAEESELIMSIGKWVLNSACAQIHAWQKDAKTRDLVLAVNVSARQFHQADFAELVQSALLRYDIRPNLLKLEITESMLLEHVDGVITTMTALKEKGVLFSLDDFGTGYSSLQYLKKLPLDELKIDYSFIRDVVSDHNDKAIVSTIIAMAHSLDLQVIAEGVETKAQLDLLRESGCLNYQGYLFGKPLPVAEFEAHLKSDSLPKTPREGNSAP